MFAKKCGKVISAPIIETTHAFQVHYIRTKAPLRSAVGITHQCSMVIGALTCILVVCCVL
jgi:hypothetical protein